MLPPREILMTNATPNSQHFPIPESIHHKETRNLDDLKSRRNARSHSPEQIALIAKAMQRFGWTTPVLIDESNTILAGYGRVEAARTLRLEYCPVLVATGWTDEEKRAYMLADNQIALRAGWDEELLRIEINDLQLMDFDLSLIGFEDVQLRNIASIGSLERPVGNLAEEFILPPFSVFDARSGWWQERKRAWLALGIQSELGRGDNALRYSETILEPDRVKRRNRGARQSAKFDLKIEAMKATPVEFNSGIWVKRDDLFQIAGVRGGKVRSCWHLAQGAKGLVTAGSRSSPQVNIVAHIARELGVPCRVHTPTGALSPEVRQAQECGAEVVQHKAGYNNVIIARAREDAAARGWTNIPFGMECWEAVRQTAGQFVATAIPEDVKRIVITVGSGMSLAGLIHGMEAAKVDLDVIGVCVGADPEDRLDRYAAGWRGKRIALIKSGSRYDEPAARTRLGEIELDSIYEAKCIPHLKAGDMFWLIGIRATEAHG